VALTNASLTISPTTLDSGGSADVWVKNTGTSQITLTNGAERTWLLPGRDMNLIPQGAVTAAVAAIDGGSGSCTYDATGSASDQIPPRVARVVGIAAGGGSVQASSTATTGTLAGGRLYQVDASSAACARTLPAANTVAAGTAVVVKKVDSSSNAVTIGLSGSDTFSGGGTSKVLTLPGESAELVSDGSSRWITKASDTPLSGLTGTFAPISGSTNYAPFEVLNRSALLPFWAALANRDAASVRIMNWGDSFSAGARCGSWPQHYGIVLARRLMAAFPCSAGNPTGGYYVPGYQSSVNGPSVPVTNTGSVSNAGAFGPGFVNLSFSATNTTTFTVTGTSVNIWCVKATSTRTFNVSIDGGADQLVTVPSAGSTTDGYLVNFSLGAAGSHTVAIKYIATPVNIGGLDVFNGDETKGVHPIPAGHSGYGANDFIAQDGVGGASLTNVAAGAAPHLITLMLGANDWGKGVESSAQFQTNLTTMIAKFKAGAPNAAILLVAPFPTQQQSTPLEPYANYVAAMKAIAQADSTIAYVDLGKTMPSTLASNTYGLYYATDNLHPLAPGHSMIADCIYRAIIPPVGA
jgi:lysophospholipase L1-like esterase